MTPTHKALEAAARAASQPGGDPWYVADDLRGQTYDQLLPQDRRFIALASPETILSLLSDLAAKDAALEEAREFIDRYSDVRDGDYGGVEPNEAMQLVHAIDQALTQGEATHD